jgi:hypothetical protein
VYAGSWGRPAAAARAVRVNANRGLTRASLYIH